MLRNSSIVLLSVLFVVQASYRSIQPQAATGSLCSSDGSSYSLTVDVSNGFRTVTTTGCPDYNWTDQSTPNEAEIKTDVYVMPSEPQICSNPTSYVGVYLDLEQTSMNSAPVMGAIGVAFDGVAIYSNSDALNRDAYIYEKQSFDECNGHAAADGTYHYHAQVPDDCLIAKPIGGQHSNLYGFMADGIPIYGPLGDYGVPPTDLDECSGHTDETYGFYHYHVIADYQYPYTVNCLKGAIDTSKWQNFANFGPVYECTNPTTYDYSSLDNVWEDITIIPGNSQPWIQDNSSSTSQDSNSSTSTSSETQQDSQPQVQVNNPSTSTNSAPQIGRAHV